MWSLKHAVSRQPFIDQAQSMNIFFDEPNNQKLTSSHFWAWKNNLKTGMYYLRSKPASQAVKFSIASYDLLSPLSPSASSTSLLGGTVPSRSATPHHIEDISESTDSIESFESIATLKFSKNTFKIKTLEEDNMCFNCSS